MWHVVAPTYWFQELDLPTKYDQIFYTLDWTLIYRFVKDVYIVFTVYTYRKKKIDLYMHLFF